MATCPRLFSCLHKSGTTKYCWNQKKTECGSVYQSGIHIINHGHPDEYSKVFEILCKVLGWNHHFWWRRMGKSQTHVTTLGDTFFFWQVSSLRIIIVYLEFDWSCWHFCFLHIWEESHNSQGRSYLLPNDSLNQSEAVSLPREVLIIS